MTDERIERVRVPLTGLAYGSWAPEEQRPGARVALDVLDSLERELTELQEGFDRLDEDDSDWREAYFKIRAERDAAREVVEAARGFLWALASANGTEGPDLRDENLGYLRTALSHHDEVTA